MLDAAEIAQFQKTGFVILRNFWSAELIDGWEQTLARMYLFQAMRIAPLREKLSDFQDKVNNPTARFTAEDFDRIMQTVEDEDKELAYHVLPMVENSAAGRSLFGTGKFMALCSYLLNCPEALLIGSGPQPFINLPSTKRLLYKWHSESTYYPKRRSFLNIWFPVFRDKSAQNGTMWFCEGSHRIAEWQFVEYQGFDKETYGRKNHFIQYEIPAEELNEFKKTPVEAKRGDVVIFQRSLVHTSTLNQSPQPSYASVGRIFDFRSDLTLSGAPGVRPFGQGDYGRPDMVVHN